MNAPSTTSGFLPSGFATAAHRSEAFAEDLFELSSFRPRAGELQRSKPARSAGVTLALVAGVPLAVAAIGGALAFWQALG